MENQDQETAFGAAHDEKTIRRPWTRAEDDNMKDMVRLHNHRWTLISKFMKGRTPGACKFCWKVISERNVNQSTTG